MGEEQITITKDKLVELLTEGECLYLITSKDDKEKRGDRGEKFCEELIAYGFTTIETITIGVNITSKVMNYYNIKKLS